MTKHQQRQRYRFEREFSRVAVVAPWLVKLRQPGCMLLRLFLGVFLMIGGLLAVLPVFGLWMIPMGLLLLAIDIPVLRAPLATIIVRARWWWHRQRAHWLKSK